MKKIFSLLLCAVLLLTCGAFQTVAADEEEFVPYVIDFSLTPSVDKNGSGNSRVTGLILSYRLQVSASENTLNIVAETNGSTEVVRCGFKNFVVERRKNGNYSWSEYHDFGDIYADTFAATAGTRLAVESGYQYRVSCKHYAKKNFLLTQTIANTSNIVIV